MRRLPTKLEIKLLNLIIEDEYLADSLRKAGFKKEIDSLFAKGYLEIYWGSYKLSGEYSVLDCEFDVEYYKSNFA